MVFLDRTPRKHDAWLAFKVAAFSAGAVLAMAGIYFNERWLIWAAIGVLLLGYGARFLPDRDREEGADAGTEGPGRERGISG